MLRASRAVRRSTLRRFTFAPQTTLTRLQLDSAASTVSGFRMMQPAAIGADTDVGGSLAAGGAEADINGADIYVSGPAPAGGVSMMGAANFQFVGNDPNGDGLAVRFKLYRRDVGGTETLIGNYDSVALGNPWTAYTFTGTIPLTLFAEGERLVVRVKAIKAAGGNVTGGYMGFTNGATGGNPASYIEVPLTADFLADDGSGGQQGGSGTLLWATGFESNTALAAYASTQAEPTQDITGTDLSTGYSWAAPPFSGDLQLFHQATQAPASSYVAASLDTLVGHTGANTKAMRLAILQTTPSWTQIPLWLLPTQSVNEIYIKLWQKLPANMQNILGANGWHHVGVEVKARDWRFISAVEIQSSLARNMHVTIDNDGNAGYPKQVFDSFQSTNAAYLPPNDGSWYQVEFYYKRGNALNGRVFLKINGNTIYDQVRQTYGVNEGAYLNRIFLSNCYGSAPYQVYIDDIEIHSTIPTP